MNDNSFYKYWGKVSKKDGDYHLLVYHCLDVAAVGRVLLEKDNYLKKKFLSLTCLEQRLSREINNTKFNQI